MDENNVNNQEGQVYVVGTRGYSAYEVAVLNGFEGTVDEWLASLIGEQGPEGPEGPQGNPGPTGLTPSIRVGSVTTGEPNTNVEISITGTPEVPIVNFKIPKGEKGDPGEVGEANYSDLPDKPQIDDVTLQGNLSLSDLGIQPAGSYLTSDDLTNYVTNTDYAEWNKGGVVKTGNGFDVASNGIAQCGAVNYSNYQTKGNTYFISKGTLEAVFTGKGFVNNTDYPSGDNAGVIKIDTNSYGFTIASGVLVPSYVDYATYQNKTNSYNIAKGTLENVITGKNLVSKTDYATGSVAGVMIASNYYGMKANSNGTIEAQQLTYSDYTSKAGSAFISKTTLDNVIAGKGLIDSTKVKTTTSTTVGDVYDVTYINTMIGDIESLLGGI